MDNNLTELIGQIKSAATEQGALADAAKLIDRLRAEIDTLQPNHHYMTKFGAELQSEVTRLHEENKQLRSRLNSTIRRYNRLIATLRGIVDQYDRQDE